MPARAARPPTVQDVVRPVENPIKATGHLQVVYGNLAPTGAVAKITGKEGLRFRGPARVFDNEQHMVRGRQRVWSGPAADVLTSLPVPPRACRARSWLN